MTIEFLMNMVILQYKQEAIKLRKEISEHVQETARLHERIAALTEYADSLNNKLRKAQKSQKRNQYCDWCGSTGPLSCREVPSDCWTTSIDDNEREVRMLCRECCNVTI